jgi:5'-deoxynucleotidase YfbR-like HD superfamily hydrolase
VRVNNVYRSGFVIRYGQNPEMAWTGQTVGHHQWGVTMLLFALFPDEVNMAVIWEALHHDTGEMGSAEMAYPAKKRHPVAAKAVSEAERNERTDMGVAEAWLPPREAAMLALCDRLESLLYTRVRTPWVLSGDGWPEMRDQVVAMAVDLGVGAAVERLLMEAGV